MQQWDDWEPQSNTPLLTRVIAGLWCGLIVPWLLWAWSTRRKEAPVKYTVDLPERMKSGQVFEVDHNRRAQDEVRLC